MGPRNEDRRRFLRAFGLGFCQPGNHAADQTIEHDDVTYCREHIPDGPAADPAITGICYWGRGHWASSVWKVPRDGRTYCAAHLLRILAIGWW
jgi:hypothetical protein